MFTFLTFINVFSFSAYGILCVFTNHMKDEFSRFGLARFRVLVGSLEFLGALGVLLGFYFNPFLYLFSSVGLLLLMILGLIVRIKIKDTFIQLTPALILLVVNCYLVIEVFSNQSF